MGMQTWDDLPSGSRIFVKMNADGQVSARVGVRHSQPKSGFRHTIGLKATPHDVTARFMVPGGKIETVSFGISRMNAWLSGWQYLGRIGNGWSDPGDPPKQEIRGKQSLAEMLEELND